MQIQATPPAGRSQLLATTLRLKKENDKLSEAESSAFTKDTPYCKRDNPSGIQLSDVGFFNDEFRKTLKRLGSESPADMVAEAALRQQSNQRVCDVSMKVASWAAGCSFVVGLPLVMMGGLDMLAGGLNLLWSQAGASGPGLGIVPFAALGVGVGVAAGAASVGFVAEDRAKAYQEFPKTLQSWHQYTATK